MNGDLEPIPCPTCWGAAEILPPDQPGDFPQSHCCAGHVNTLIPDVLATLRDVRNLAEKRWLAEQEAARSGDAEK